MNIRNATALVTGANRGIGRAVVQALLAAGAPRVYATARNPSSLADLVALDPGRVRALRLDVTDAASIAAVAAQAGDVNLLVNNAGMLEFGDSVDADIDSIDRQIRTNTLGTLAVTRALLPAIERNGGGAIANLLSVLSLASMPGVAGYSASKAALWSITQSLRATLKGRGIDVIGVFPGPVDTDMAAEFAFDKTSPADVARAIVEGIAKGVEDVFPDPMSTETYSAWSGDHKAVERQFAG